MSSAAPLALGRGRVAHGELLLLPRPWLRVADQRHTLRDAPVRPACGEPYVFQHLHRGVDGTLYARGSVRHPGHATVRLGHWHQVVINTANGASAGTDGTFLD